MKHCGCAPVEYYSFFTIILIKLPINFIQFFIISLNFVTIIIIETFDIVRDKLWCFTFILYTHFIWINIIFGGMDCGNWEENKISLRSLLLLLGWCCVLALVPKQLFSLSSCSLLQFLRSSPFLRTFCYFLYLPKT